jgi:hypothetical protein
MRTASASNITAFADYQPLYRQLGITAAAARDSIHDAQNGTRRGRHPAAFARRSAAPPTVLSDPEVRT